MFTWYQEIVFFWKTIPGTLLTVLVHGTCKVSSSDMLMWQSVSTPWKTKMSTQKIRNKWRSCHYRKQAGTYHEERKRNRYFEDDVLCIRGCYHRAVAEKRQNRTLWDFLKSKNLDAQKPCLETEWFHCRSKLQEWEKEEKDSYRYLRADRCMWEKETRKMWRKKTKNTKPTASNFHFVFGRQIPQITD